MGQPLVLQGGSATCVPTGVPLTGGGRAAAGEGDMSVRPDQAVPARPAPADPGRAAAHGPPSPTTSATCAGLVEQVLFTRPGERVNRPTSAAASTPWCSPPPATSSRSATRALVHGALQRFLGELIRVDEVDVVAVDDATLEVTVVYTPLRAPAGTPQPRAAVSAAARGLSEAGRDRGDRCSAADASTGRRGARWSRAGRRWTGSTSSRCSATTPARRDTCRAPRASAPSWSTCSTCPFPATGTPPGSGSAGGVRADPRVNPVGVEWAYPALAVAGPDGTPDGPLPPGVRPPTGRWSTGALPPPVGARERVLVVRTTTSGDWSTYRCTWSDDGGDGCAGRLRRAARPGAVHASRSTARATSTARCRPTPPPRPARLRRCRTTWPATTTRCAPGCSTGCRRCCPAGLTAAPPTRP